MTQAGDATAGKRAPDPDTSQARLWIRYPRSFAMLLLFGFALVALPLVGGMINTIYLLERVNQDSHRAFSTTVEATRATRQLVDDATALQRAAGQFLVLEDPGLRKGLLSAHQRFQETAAAIGNLPLDREQQAKVQSVSALESDLFTRTDQQRGSGALTFDALAPDFGRLRDATQDIVALGNQLVDRQTGEMAQASENAWRVLIFQAIAIVPLSFGMALVFAWLINRPVRQLARAIRRLGDNDLSPGPVVDGPKDLVYLGERMDWLRLRLLALEEQKIRFLRHVSHELKTPLASLREGVALLADRVGGELTEQQVEITQIMRGNVRDLQRRIEDLLAYSRVVQQDQELKLEDVDLGAVWETVLARQALALRGKGLVVEQDLQAERCRSDRTMLDTVFDNLLVNAVRFSPEGGRIAVRSSMGEGRVMITVCDQGPGIPAEEREQVFLPFYQGTNQPSGPLRGSGLGLSIVREYVAALGGWVSLTDAPGGGTCFQVVLGAAQGNGEHA